MISIDTVIDKCQQYADSGRPWSTAAFAVPGKMAKPEERLRLLYRSALASAISGDPVACFASAEEIARDRSGVNTGPRGFYSVRHLCAAVWYKSQGRMDDCARLLRVATEQVDDRLLS